MTPRLTPWSIRNVPSVTMKLGSLVRTTISPLTNPTSRATTRDTSIAAQIVQTVPGGEDDHDEAGGAGEHPGRQVELPADHQQRDRHRHDPERGGRVQPVGDALDRTERGRLAREEREDRDRADHRAEFRPDSEQPPAATSGPGEPLVRHRHRVPLSASLATCSALSLVTKPGPV